MQGRFSTLTYRCARARRCARKWRKRLGVVGIATLEDAKRLAASIGRAFVYEFSIGPSEGTGYVTVRTDRHYVAIIDHPENEPELKVAAALVHTAALAVFRNYSRLPLAERYRCPFRKGDWRFAIAWAFAAAFIGTEGGASNG